MQDRRNENHRFQILSLDGGGLKGLFTAAFLAEWEEHTGRPVTGSTDLIAGTSVGGIVALGLGAGYSAKEIVEFFLEHGEAIFPTEPFELIGSIRQCLGTRYTAKPLEDALNSYFGDRRMGDSCVRLIVPAFHTESGLHLFKTSHHPRLRIDYQEKMSVIARATSAAPTYLPPLLVKPGIRFIDGGLIANNPIQVAVTEAMSHLCQPQNRIAAVRIGTTTEPIPKDRYPEDLRAIDPRTLALFVDLVVRGQSQLATGAATHLLGKGRFVDINPVVAPSDFKIHKLSEELIGLAKTVFRETVSDLDEKGFLDHRAKPFVPCHSRREEISDG